MLKRQMIGCLLLAGSVIAATCSLRFSAAGTGSSFSASGRPGSFPAPSLPDGTVCVNLAEAEELVALPGIGETMAQLIVGEREAHGPFHYPEDLLSVKGIGTSKLKKIRPLLDLSLSP